MQSLEALTREASALADGGAGALGRIPVVVVRRNDSDAAVAEVARQMHVRNACRYCEGFCAVFPAMTRRLDFGAADVHFLANLCHNCGACLHACQYAPPHEFAINVPHAMARVRARTYAEYAWPRPLGRLYERNGLTLSLALALGLSLFLILAVAMSGSLWGPQGQGNFYRIFPHNLLVSMFAPVFLFVVLALAMGVSRFWRDLKPVTGQVDLNPPAAAEATRDALGLRYLDGGHGEGCHESDEGYTRSRRRFHHLTFYGFMLCFAATSLGTVYHYAFGWAAPYDLPSLPKLLGAIGGISMTWGTAGLGWLRLRRHPAHALAEQKPMDLGFIALLFLTAVSGLLLWWGRGTNALALLLCIHLGAVMALFATLPYGKFAHGAFRVASLLRHAVERRLPSPIGLGAE